MKLGKPKKRLDFKTLVATIRGAIAMTGMSINGIICYFFFFISRGKLIGFNYKYVSPFFCRITLRLIGCKIKYPQIDEYPDRQVMYLFNHNSYLDIFIIPSMRIPNCRYIISETTSNVFPLYLCNVANGAIFIPRRREKERRDVFFKKTTNILKDQDFSVFTSPEGTHLFQHWIAPFNRGVFKMAMEANIALCPIFFNMKSEHNPFESFHFKGGGTTNLSILPLIETDDWTEENLDENIVKVRNIFVNHFNKVHGEKIQ